MDAFNVSCQALYTFRFNVCMIFSELFWLKFELLIKLEKYILHIKVKSIVFENQISIYVGLCLQKFY